MPKVSIIVPVFNTENYIEQCLDSLVNQTFNDIEIIIINDCSTDNSENIVKNYLNKYSNKIKYFSNEKNFGISYCRNYGVSLATGDYIMFVDSDDYIDSNLLLNLEEYLNKNIDLIKYKLVIKNIENNNLTHINGPIFNVLSGENAFNSLIYKDTLLESPCLYLFRRDFILENNFKFTVDTYHEDFGLIPLIILKASSVISTEIYGYYYIQSYNSITRDTNYNKIFKRAYDLLLHYDVMISKLENYNISEKAKDNLKIFFTNSILLKTQELNLKDKKTYINEIKKRGLINNIKITNLKQLIKKIALKISIDFYLKIR